MPSGSAQLGKVEVWRDGCRSNISVAAPSSGGALLARTWLCFHTQRHLVASMPAPVASGWSESPGGPRTHWKAPPCHGARRFRPFVVFNIAHEIYTAEPLVGPWDAIIASSRFGSVVIR